MKFKYFFILFFILCIVYNSYAQTNTQSVSQFDVDIPEVIIQHIPADMEITIPAFIDHFADTVDIRINKKLSTVMDVNFAASGCYFYGTCL